MPETCARGQFSKKDVAKVKRWCVQKKTTRGGGMEAVAMGDRREKENPKKTEGEPLASERQQRKKEGENRCPRDKTKPRGRGKWGTKRVKHSSSLYNTPKEKGQS